MKKACMLLPSAVWTLTFNENLDGTVTILNFDKEDNDGYMFSSTLPVLQAIKEDENRVVSEVTVDGKTFSVQNPQNVFTYKQPL